MGRGRKKGKQTKEKKTTEKMGNEESHMQDDHHDTDDHSSSMNRGVGRSMFGGGDGGDEQKEVATEDWKGRPLRVQGLANNGNTCFFNSVLQSLSQTYQLHEELENCRSQVVHRTITAKFRPSLEIQLRPQRTGQEMAQALHGLFSQMRREPSSRFSWGSLSPREVHGVLGTHESKYKGYRQEDSAEALRYILCILRDEEVQRIENEIDKKLKEMARMDAKYTDQKCEAMKKAYRKNYERDTFVDHVFGGRLEVQTTCRIASCGYVNTSKSCFLELCLALGSVDDPGREQERPPAAIGTLAATAAENHRRRGNVPGDNLSGTGRGWVAPNGVADASSERPPATAESRAAARANTPESSKNETETNATVTGAGDSATRAGADVAESSKDKAKTSANATESSDTAAASGADVTESGGSTTGTGVDAAGTNESAVEGPEPTSNIGASDGQELAISAATSEVSSAMVGEVAALTGNSTADVGVAATTGQQRAKDSDEVTDGDAQHPEAAESARPPAQEREGDGEVVQHPVPTDQDGGGNQRVVVAERFHSACDDAGDMEPVSQLRTQGNDAVHQSLPTDTEDGGNQSGAESDGLSTPTEYDVIGCVEGAARLPGQDLAQQSVRTDQNNDDDDDAHQLSDDEEFHTPTDGDAGLDPLAVDHTLNEFLEQKPKRDDAAIEPEVAAIEPEAAAIEPEAAAIEPEAAAIEPEAAAIELEEGAQGHAYLYPSDPAGGGKLKGGGTGATSTSSGCGFCCSKPSQPPADDAEEIELYNLAARPVQPQLPGVLPSVDHNPAIPQFQHLDRSPRERHRQFHEQPSTPNLPATQTVELAAAGSGEPTEPACGCQFSRSGISTAAEMVVYSDMAPPSKVAADMNDEEYMDDQCLACAPEAAYLSDTVVTTQPTAGNSHPTRVATGDSPMSNQLDVGSHCSSDRHSEVRRSPDDDPDVESLAASLIHLSIQDNDDFVSSEPRADSVDIPEVLQTTDRSVGSNDEPHADPVDTPEVVQTTEWSVGGDEESGRRPSASSASIRKDIEERSAADTESGIQRLDDDGDEGSHRGSRSLLPDPFNDKDPALAEDKQVPDKQPQITVVLDPENVPLPDSPAPSIHDISIPEEDVSKGGRSSDGDPPATAPADPHHHQLTSRETQDEPPSQEAQIEDYNREKEKEKEEEVQKAKEKVPVHAASTARRDKYEHHKSTEQPRSQRDSWGAGYGSYESRKPIKLEDCLGLLTSPEYAYGKNAICDMCSAARQDGQTEALPESEGNVVRTQKIAALPKVLILTLKRFRQVGRRLQKRNDRVPVSDPLDLAPYCTDECLKELQADAAVCGQRVLYTPFAVIEHGGSVEEGHYVAYVKSRQPLVSASGQEGAGCAGSMQKKETRRKKADTGWFYVSDSTVRQSTAEAALHAQAYAIFYEPLMPSSSNN